MRKYRKYIYAMLAVALLVSGVRRLMSVEAQEEGLQEEAYLREEERLQKEERLRTAGEALERLAAEQEIPALLYLADEYPVRRGPSYGSGAAVTVLSGQRVYILGLALDGEGEVWYSVRLSYLGSEIRGYVPRRYLASSDQRFLQWEEAYGLHTATYVAEENADIACFPESYRPALLALREKHPGWVFVKLNTALDWAAAVGCELQEERSLVYRTFPDWAREGLYDSGDWYFASEDVLKLYMDPRNHLTEGAVFQFEELTYNAAYHTQEVVTSFLDNACSFMKSGVIAPGTQKGYAEIFYGAGSTLGVSPFHLVARVMQEQGDGKSPLISGRYPGYEGHYNYFNIKASGTSDEEIFENGLRYAREKGWTDAEKAIWGGAGILSANYIRKGQNTLYLQKFNVTPNGSYPVYTHQYMQNISAPASESVNIKRLYAKAGALENRFVFSIPVYENMPEAPSPRPEASTNVVLKLPNGYSDTAVWLDGVPYAGERRDGRLIAAAPDGNSRTAVLYRYDAAGVPVGMYVWSLRYSGTAYVAEEEPELEDLLTYHGFSVRVAGRPGIRFKTGISAVLRERLTSGGVNGYTLGEYGTLVMKRENLDRYPMVKGGGKVAGGMSYGTDDGGRPLDRIFETVDGRHRFTSVLVGLPAEQYRTEFAFRGYAVLEKDGERRILYGPVRARSIYGLASSLLRGGTYQPGSAAYAFLEKLIGDADALEQQETEIESKGEESRGYEDR